MYMIDGDKGEDRMDFLSSPFILTSPSISSAIAAKYEMGGKYAVVSSFATIPDLPLMQSRIP
jgi:hypothetical protein